LPGWLTKSVLQACQFAHDELEFSTGSDDADTTIFFQKSNVGTLIGVRDDMIPEHNHLVSTLEIVDRGNVKKLSTLEPLGLVFLGGVVGSSFYRPGRG
jgi:hypothetical protein